MFENKVYAGLSWSLSKIYLPPAGAGAILRWPVPLHLLTLNEVSRHKHITVGGGLELETKVAEDYAKFYNNHGEGPY